MLYGIRTGSSLNNYCFTASEKQGVIDPATDLGKQLPQTFHLVHRLV